MRTELGLATVAMCFGVVAGAEGPVFHAGFDGDARGTFSAVPGGKVTPQVSGSGRYVPGVKGQARVLGGRNICVYHLDGGFFPAGGSWTMWVRPEDWQAAESRNFVFFASLTHADSVREYVRVVLYKVHNETNVTLLVQNTTAGKTVSVKAPIEFWRKGQWHQLAFTWDKQEYRLYVDGEPAGSRTAAELPATGRWQVRVGTPYAGWAHVGDETTAIDEVMMWPGVLSADEIRASYRAIAATLPAGSVPKDEDVEEEGPMKENLALAKNGAFVLSSSFRHATTYYTDNLIDGKPETTWRPLDESLPQWVEVRWDTPLRIDEVVLRQPKTPRRIVAFAVSAWEREAWRVVGRLDVENPGSTRRVAVQFPEVVADRLRVAIEKASTHGVELASLEVHGPEQPIIGHLKPYWNAWYVWYPEPDKVHKANAPRYFRKTFEVADVAALRGAVIQLRSNDYYQAFVNGHEVATGAKLVKPVDVKRFIQTGENVVAVMADLRRNPGRWGWGELIFELGLNYDDRSDFVASDAQCRAFDREVKGWRGPGFDDGDWTKAEAFLKPPDGVWGTIPYFPSGVNETVVLESTSMKPESPKPGDTIAMEVSLRPMRKLKDDYVFLLEIEDEPLIASWSEFLVGRTSVSPAVPTSRWTPREGGRLTVNVYLPAHTPRGDTPIRLKGYGTRHGRALDIVDEAGDKLDEIGKLRIGPSGQPPTEPAVATRAPLGNE